MSQSKAAGLLGWAVVIAAAGWALALAFIFVLRATFPLELEWMEGGSLHTALRIQSGQPVYGEPSADFVPFLYTPGYPFVLAVLGKVFPLNYGLGRAVSIGSTGFSCWAIYKIVRGESSQSKSVAPAARIDWREGGLVAPATAIGLFLAGYVFSFRWMDVARNDSLYLCLVLWGLYAIRHAQGNLLRAGLAGLAMACAFWTKQTAFVFIVASGLAALCVHRPKDWAVLAVFVATIAALSLGGLWLGQGMTQGHLWEWIYTRHQAHAFNDERFRQKTWGMFAHALPFELVALSLGAGGLVGRFAAGGEKWTARLDKLRGLAYWSIVAAAGLLVSGLGYSTQWAEPNAFLPGVAVLAVLLGVLTAQIRVHRGALPPWLSLAIGGLVLVQMLFAAGVEPLYQPIQDDGRAGLGESYVRQRLARTVPSADQRARANKLRDRLEDRSGLVLAYHRPWWAVLAGGAGHVGSMGLNDIDADDRSAIEAQLAGHVVAQRYAEVWIDGEPPKWLRRALARGYRVGQRRQGNARARPMSGYMSDAGMVTAYRNDQVLYVPAVPSDGAGAEFDFEDGTEAFTRSGRAFSARTSTGFVGNLPPAGPHRGSRLWHSLGTNADLKRQGTATSEAFALEGGTLTMLLGTTGRRKGLRVEVLVDDVPVHTFKPKKGRFRLRRTRWDIPAELIGVEVQLRLVDESTRGGLFIDDVRFD